MRLDPRIVERRDLIKQIASEHGALNVRVFGCVRGVTRDRTVTWTC